MKKIALIFIYIISCHTFAETLAQNDMKEFKLIQIQYDKKLINYEQLHNQLIKCSKKGNKYCISSIGLIYFETQKYDLAYPYLIKSQGIYNGFNQTIAPSEWALAYMYDNGLGVLQNEEKAIEHYKKCAFIGDKNCAFNIGAIYFQKAVDLSTTSTRSHDLYSYTIKAYAWYKISQALGRKTATNTNTGKKEKFSESLNKIKIILVHSGKSHLIEADKLARQICTSIPKCKQ